MATPVECPSCARRLRVSDQVVGKRIRCPDCSQVFLASPPDEPEEVPEERITQRPTVRKRRPGRDESIASSPATRRRAVEEDEEPVRTARRRRRGAEADEREEVEEVTDDSDERPARKSGKRKRKGHGPSRPAEEEELAWPWWVFGGGGICFTMFALLGTAILAPTETRLKAYAAYLLIAMPISTVIFFVAMFLSSVLVGAMEIGKIHVAIVKAFIILFVINVINLAPMGCYITLPFWIVLLMVLFRLDLWEAGMLMFINWVLNWAISFFLMAAFLSWMMKGGAGLHFDTERPAKVRPVNPNEWTEDDVARRGGLVDFDPGHGKEDVVIGISFRDARIGDADLAHMKDFPRLHLLDLTNTPITDAGLAHLKSCKALQVITLTKTNVTDAGVQDLQQTFPWVKMVR